MKDSLALYNKQWNEDVINGAVAEVITKLVNNPKFETAVREKLDTKIDVSEIENEIEGLEKQLRQLAGAKSRLEQQMDTLDIEDKLYEKKYRDMANRLDKLYYVIEDAESSLDEVQRRLKNVEEQKISSDNLYQFLLFFDKLYMQFTDLEKKMFMNSFVEFMNSFVERVDIYENEQADGRILNHIKFRFPVFVNGVETREISWDNSSAVECVCLLCKHTAI